MFVLASPWALLGLPLPLLVWFLLPPAQSFVTLALKVPFFKSMHGLVDSDKHRMKHPGFLALLLSWFCLVVALAGPEWVGAPRLLSRDSYNIMLALDISPSMSVEDMMDRGRRVTRLFAVKRAAKQFVLNRVGDKIGLILFGEQAYLLTPLTYDRHNVIERLNDATVGLAGKSTSIGDALGLAIKRLQHLPAKGRMIVLLTDGVSNSGVIPPRKAAELAKAEGVKIYTIGLHSEIDSRSFDGMFLNLSGAADLDEPTLKAVAKMTGGHYFRATDQASLDRIYRYINTMARTSQAQATVRPQHEYYPWFLGLGLLILVGVIMLKSGLFAYIERIGGIRHG